ncbi:hypothetical protein H5T87_08705 [bacterium]|nr:hypothetical protein [bacterium]
MLRRLEVLVLFSVLLAGSIAFSQPIALSESQMENAKAGCWAMCDKLYVCHQACTNIYVGRKSYEILGQDMYQCSFSIWPASCSNLAQDFQCGTRYNYADYNCTGGLIGSVAIKDDFCGIAP